MVYVLGSAGGRRGDYWTTVDGSDGRKGEYLMVYDGVMVGQASTW